MATNAENVVSKLGLKHLETDKPKGSVILDLGHPKFKKDLSYQFASTTNSPMHMAITANQLVPALKRCLPHSASEIRAVLQVTATSPSWLHDLCMHGRS